MFRVIRVPPSLDKFVQPLQGHVHWEHFPYCRRLVLTLALMWGRRHVANVSRYLEAAHHRTRVHNFLLVERWAPEAARRQQAQAWLRVRHPGQGAPLDWIIDDSKTAKRGQAMDAIATMKDATTDAYIRGHQSVCGLLLFRGHVIPWGLRL
jgi:hypothetical protein